MEKRTYKADHQLQEILRAIKENDLELAIKNAEGMYKNAKNMHDGLIEMFSLALNYIAEKEGEDGIGNVWRYIGEKKYVAKLEAYKAGKMTYEIDKEYIRLGEMAHYSDFTAEEDDEKIVFSMHDCGVCGRLMKEGKLDSCKCRSGLDLGTIKEPHDWTLGYTGMPYYCIHAPYFFNILGKEHGYDAFEFKWGRQLDEDGNIIDEPCQEIIYKKPRNK